MSQLTNELKSEHATLVKILGEVKELGVASEEGREKLMSAKEGLLAHLSKEDEKLYPTLKQQAETDDNVKVILDTFAKDMEGISAVALDFFDKYQEGGSAIEFSKDFGTLYGALGNRIRKEETILYAEYEKLAD